MNKSLLMTALFVLIALSVNSMWAIEDATSLAIAAGDRGDSVVLKLGDVHKDDLKKQPSAEKSALLDNDEEVSDRAFNATLCAVGTFAASAIGAAMWAMITHQGM